MVEYKLFTCSVLMLKILVLWQNYMFSELEELERVSYVLSQ